MKEFVVCLVVANLAAAFQSPTISKKYDYQLEMSVPNSLDTLTSGLASIVRVGDNGLAGVTVRDDTEKNLVRLNKLYDIENSRDCRVVRERMTELDLVVEKIIPACANSRAIQDGSFEHALPQGADVPCLIASIDGEERVISGASYITEFLNEACATVDDSAAEDEGEALQKIIKALNPIGLYAASLLRSGRGDSISPAADPSKWPSESLILYSYEGNQFCRLVREVLTELDIIWELRSAGKGSPRRSELAELTGGSTQCPYLVDPNTGIAMGESADIIRYLYQTYGRWTPPSELLEWVSNSVMPALKSVFAYLTPLQAGSNREEYRSYTSEIKKAKEEIEAETSAEQIVIYTYDLSPFSSETKAVLDGLNVKYKSISLGKEWIPGLLSPSGATKRAALLEMTGQSSLPHIFINGKPIGGLFGGSPGLVPLLEGGKFMEMVQEVTT